MSLTEHPVPKTIADKLREIPVGESRWFGKEEAAPWTIRSTITRIKTDAETNYTTRPDGQGLRVWRLG